jgi:hypothetical protein
MRDYKPGAKEIYLLVLMALSNYFLFINQNLLATKLSGVASDFGLSSEQRDMLLGGQNSL